MCVCVSAERKCCRSIVCSRASRYRRLWYCYTSGYGEAEGARIGGQVGRSFEAAAISKERTVCAPVSEDVLDAGDDLADGENLRRTARRRRPKGDGRCAEGRWKRSGCSLFLWM